MGEGRALQGKVGAFTKEDDAAIIEKTASGTSAPDIRFRSEFVSNAARFWEIWSQPEKFDADTLLQAYQLMGENVYVFAEGDHEQLFAKIGELLSRIPKGKRAVVSDVIGLLAENVRQHAGNFGLWFASEDPDSGRLYVICMDRGTGELPGVVYESVTYEAYGPGGVAILVEVLTDNKNRTSAELRNIMSKKGGNFAGAGSVSWMFAKKGYFLIEKSQAKEDDLMNIVLEAGAEDMKSDDKNYEVFTVAQNFEKVKQALEGKGIKCQDAEVTMIPSSTIRLTGGDAKQLLGLIDTLEEHDDVQQVYANFDIPDEIMEQAANA
jgi:YebC/PmpR family DNA-binding regulatory protein